MFHCAADRAPAQGRGLLFRRAADRAPADGRGLYRPLRWLIHQRWWIVPLYLLLELGSDFVAGRPTSLVVLFAGTALLVANGLSALWLERCRGDERRLRWVAAVQIALDVSASTLVAIADVKPADAMGYGLLASLLVNHWVLPRNRAAMVAGLATLLLAVVIDVARTPWLEWPRWIIATAAVASLALLIGALNVRRALLHAGLEDRLEASRAELQRAQEMLVQRERMAAVGELAAIVAHEVRNPIGVIYNAVGGLRRLAPEAGPARELVDIVGDEAARLNRVTSDLLEFARAPRLDVARVPIEAILESALNAVLLGEGAPNVRVVKAIEQGLPALPADPQQLRRAFVNLMQNALQAMARGGVLTIRARGEGTPVAAIRVDVQDTGAGIPEEVRPRLFEPFFTTKTAGTGLGLAIVKRVVDRHRGRVSVETAPGRGTTFAIFLPLDVSAAREEYGPARTPAFCQNVLLPAW